MVETKRDKRAPIPHLRREEATQLIVDGRPYLILGGELHNSSSSSLAYMEPIWERLVGLHLNTVLAVVAWELVELEEGVFDFALVDGLIEGARRHGLRLVPLWFGTWKNGMSSYAPSWVKRDYRRFPRVQVEGGQPVEILSAFAPATQEADARAFAAFMRHLYQVDGDQHTAIMVQVQNEVGVLGDSRDRSAVANAAFAADVPPALMQQLAEAGDELDEGLRQRWQQNGGRDSGSWEEVFGQSVETDEVFMAWHYARYIDAVAAAGRAEYPLPMFANAWLSSLDSTPAGWASGGQKPGEWPSGGPLPQTLDIWRAGAPNIDFLSPDIYQPNFQDWCRAYTRRGNPLFIPEMRRGQDGARLVFYALGQHDALGVSPFAIDDVEPGPDEPLQRSYAVLRQLADEILAHQGTDAMIGFLLDEETPALVQPLGGYELVIERDQGFGQAAERGCGLIIATGPDQFLGAGFGFRVGFKGLSPGPLLAGLAAVDEGQFKDGQWLSGRRLNGDETGRGHWWRFRDFGRVREGTLAASMGTGISRCSVYRYE
ncbi:MAG: glycoside hydrolase family 42 [Candidatus Latescibacteria bacterium]|nr:glycoside hydrolase family 42 [Candidatus Latescibacterota bacterium]